MTQEYFRFRKGQKLEGCLHNYTQSSAAADKQFAEIKASNVLNNLTTIAGKLSIRQHHGNANQPIANGAKAKAPRSIHISREKAPN